MFIQLSSLSNIFKTLTLSREDDSRKVSPKKNTCGNFSDTLFNFEKFVRNVAGYGNFEKNIYKSLGTWQVSETYEKSTSP